MKKIISLSTIVVAGISALIPILAIFSILKLKGATLDVLWTSLTLTVAGIFLLNSCSILDKNKIAAFTSMGLIGVSSLLVILCFWTEIENNSEAFLKATIVVSILSVCFNIISSFALRLGKAYLIPQIISYVCFSAISLLVVIIIILGKFLDWRVYVILIILSLFAYAMLTVLAKKQPVETVSKEYVKITKEEYEDLLSKKAELEKLLAKK